MKLVTELWDIKELITKKATINPKPQYQRTPVWTEERKAFLIDSILRGYDLPKFYMIFHNKGNPFEYEVADGQQRMRSIWEFCNNEYSLGKNIIINNTDLSGRLFRELPKVMQASFLKFEINITLILEHSPGEINELFTRLQKGVSLNPPELRHAMYSEIAFYVNSFLERKKVKSFFEKSGIKDVRFKNQDYIDHVITLIHFQNKKDLKAASMYQLYLDFSDAKISEFKQYFDNAEKVIEKMEEINSYKRGIFKNKWAFVDYFWLLYKDLARLDKINAENFAKQITEFETERLAHNAKPERLLKLKKVKFGEPLYNYIQAFNKDGARKENISIRNIVLKDVFKNI